MRDPRIDFWRGLALVFIFWDHIPGNRLGELTLRNIGLSDAAELFVFLAGFGAAKAWGPLLLRQGYAVACQRILKRAATLYVAHIFLMVLLMAVVFVANAHVETRDFISEMHLETFLTAPDRVLVDAVLLRFRPVLLDPLPLYIVLVLAMGAALPLLVHRPLLLLALSGLLYALWPDLRWPSRFGDPGWFFNPLAWQFLFFIGALAALHGQRLTGLLASRPAQAAAAMLLVAAAALAFSWRVPDLHDQVMPQAVAHWLYPIDKTNLDILRLIHFLLLAWLAAVWVPAGRWTAALPARLLQAMGRRSLPVFCAGVVLVPVADALATVAGSTLMADLLVGFGGFAAMAVLALVLDWFARPLPTPRPAV
ncbi:OpgC family protein [Novispirillum itersonii]|uniref:OpgC family protein n=1 Tax=Novispirillum itersonii TaxID=189 RepID=UPI000363A114|nr:OpgC domain-containing protein [Novispirillum itersonii]